MGREEPSPKKTLPPARLTHRLTSIATAAAEEGRRQGSTCRASFGDAHGDVGASPTDATHPDVGGGAAVDRHACGANSGSRCDHSSSVSAWRCIASVDQHRHRQAPLLRIQGQALIDRLDGRRPAPSSRAEDGARRRASTRSVLQGHDRSGLSTDRAVNFRRGQGALRAGPGRQARHAPKLTSKSPSDVCSKRRGRSTRCVH